MRTILLTVLLTCVAFASVPAEVQTRVIEYTDGEVPLTGFLAWDDELTAKRPGVLVVHQWTGQGEYEQRRARMLAELGYVAFAADIYGEGIRPAAGQEAGEWAGKFKGDRALYRRRLVLGLEVLKAQDMTDSSRLGAVGYCFGGTGVLELARSGADIDAVVSFHGGLDSPTPEDGRKIRCKVLVCHGADDPYVPDEELQAFVKEMDDADVDYVFISYADAVHSFTHPAAGDDKSRGAAYNETADMRSWEHMKLIFQEAFGN